MRVAKWLVGSVLALLLVLLVAGNIFGWYLLGYTREHFPMPGKLIALKTHRLHMHCTGKGRPTVLLESGSGAWSTHWALVQAKVASFTRVCSYDRAGLGWSDPGPKPYDIESNVRDLDELLAHSGEEGPFVFAGWSFGGSIVWLYTQGHVDQSAGLIVVDGRPGGFQTWMDEFAPELKARREGFAATLRRLERVGFGPAFSWYLLRGSNRDSIKGFPAGTGDVLLDPGFFARMFDALIEASDTDDISERQMDMRQSRQRAADRHSARPRRHVGACPGQGTSSRNAMAGVAGATREKIHRCQARSSRNERAWHSTGAAGHHR